MYIYKQSSSDSDGSPPSLSALEPTEEPGSAGDGTTRKSEATRGVSPTKNIHIVI